MWHTFLSVNIFSKKHLKKFAYSKNGIIFDLSKSNNMTTQNKIRKQIISNQILRLAKIYISKKVCVENINWHYRVTQIQIKAINEKRSIK